MQASRPVSSRALRGLLGGVVLCLATLPTFLSGNSEAADREPERPTLAVVWAGHRGLAQDWLRTALPDLLNAAFVRVPTFQVLERARLEALEKEHRLSSLLEGDLARRLKQLAKVRYVVVGTSAVDEETLYLRAMLFDAETGEPRGGLTEAAGRLEELAALVDRLVRALVARLETPLRPEELERLRFVPTGDLTALQWYSRGEEALVRGTYTDALEAFFQASEAADPFAWAERGLAQTYELLGENEHAVVAYQRAVRESDVPEERCRLALALARLLRKAHDEAGARAAWQMAAEALRQMVGDEPLVQMPRQELWARYGEGFRRYFPMAARGSSSAAPGSEEEKAWQEMRAYQSSLQREASLVSSLLRLAHILDRLGEKGEALRFRSRGWLLYRLSLNKAVEDWLPPAQEGTAERPEWVVEVPRGKPSFTFSVDQPDWWRFAFLDYGGACYRIGFVAPCGRYFLKATATAASEGDRSRRLHVPRFQPIGGWRLLGDLWSQFGMSEAEKALFETDLQRPPGGEENPSEGEESQPTGRETFLFQAGTEAFAVRIPAFDFPLTPDPAASSREAFARTWRFDFTLTGSPEATELPMMLRDAGKPGPPRYPLDIHVAPRGAEVLVNREPLQRHYWRQVQESYRVYLPRGALAKVRIHAPDGPSRSFTITTFGCEHLYVPVRAGWRPVKEPLPGDGWLMQGQDGLFRWVTAYAEPGEEETDLFLLTSKDLSQWSSPQRLAVSKGYNGSHPTLVQGPDGTYHLFWYSPRLWPGETSTLWTACSEDLVHWSDPLQTSGDSHHAYGFAGGLALFHGVGSGGQFSPSPIQLRMSWDGERWEQHDLSGKGWRWRMGGVGVGSDGVLHALFFDAQSGHVALHWGTSLDAVHWERRPTLLPDLGATYVLDSPVFLTRSGWILHLWVGDRERPRQSTSTWLLLASPEEARVLPSQDCLCGAKGLLDTGDRLVAWGSYPPPDACEVWTRLWVCPAGELADVPVEALPMFQLEAPPEAGSDAASPAQP